MFPPSLTNRFFFFYHIQVDKPYTVFLSNTNTQTDVKSWHRQPSCSHPHTTDLIRTPSVASLSFNSRLFTIFLPHILQTCCHVRDCNVHNYPWNSFLCILNKIDLFSSLITQEICFFKGPCFSPPRLRLILFYFTNTVNLSYNNLLYFSCSKQPN